MKEKLELSPFAFGFCLAWLIHEGTPPNDAAIAILESYWSDDKGGDQVSLEEATKELNLHALKYLKENNREVN